MSSGITVVTLPEKDLHFTDPKKWFEGLLYFLYTNILPQTLSSSTANIGETLEKLVSEKTYPIWTACFTHPTFNPNPDSNYDTLEKIGDAVMKLTFLDFQLNLNPTLDQESLSQIVTRYLAKPEQRKKSDQLGLRNWVRIVKEIDYSTSEDLLESMFGAIFRVGKIVLGKADGYSLCNNLIINLYKDEKIEIRKDPISKIKEIFEKMHWSEEEQFKPAELGSALSVAGGDWEITLRLTPKARNYLINVAHKEIRTDIIANHRGSQKGNVQNEAYTIALETLEREYGVTSEWAVMKSEEEEAKLFTAGSRQRQHSEGYVSIYFGKQIKGKTDQLLQLIGEDAKGRKRVILTVTAPKEANLWEIKKFAVELYAKQGSLTHYKPVLFST